jgi:isoleucyl-tRNA synthetase
VDEKFIDKKLEENMDFVLKLVVQGRACRNKANIKNRQPIGKMYVNAKQELPEMFKDLVADELNVKEIIFTDNVNAFTTYKFKPQLRTLGPKYGKLVPKIAEALNHVDGNEVMALFKRGETLTLDIEGNQVELAEQDVLSESIDKEGMVAETDYGITVVLDTNLTPELIEEGFVREIISKIQTMRKEAGFDIQDNIHVYYSNNVRIAEIMKNNEKEIGKEVLAKAITEGAAEGYTKEWNVNGEKVTFTVVKM